MSIIKYIKILSSLLTLIFIVFGCNALDNPLDPNNENLVLKTETKWVCDIETSQKLYKLYQKEFNNKGNLTNYLTYNEFGVLESKSSYKYSENNTIEVKSIYSSEGSVAATEQFSYQYDNNGRLEKKLTYADNGSISFVEQYKYDDKGNLLSSISIDSAGKFSSEKSYSYSYNNNGNVVERYENLDGSGKYSSRDSLSYLLKELKVELIRFDALGKVNIKYTYLFDNKGYVIEEYEYLPSGDLFKKYKIDYTFYR